MFHRARELTPGERDAFLAEACAGDDALRHEVQAVLAAGERTGDFLEAPGPELPTDFLRSLSEGTRLGPYEIVAPIGAGGMGEVYRGRDTRLHRTVAIKVLSGSMIDDPERRQRFVREARAASALNHPNIVTLHDIGSENGVDFFVMEYVPEKSLDELISSQPLPLAEVLDYGIQIANAVAAAHAAGIIHRDIKPANVMVTREGQVKVLDFGLAKWPQSPAIDPDVETRMTTKVSLTQAGQIMGTVAYMSPEQARGERLDARTDLFSFGAVLYEIAAGRPAFPKAFDWTPPSAAGIHPSLYRIILKLVQANRDARYVSTVDVVADLKRLQQSLQSTQSRRRQQLVLASALALLALLTVAFFRFRPTEPTPQNKWVQLTNMPDSASQPALSADGRMLAFIRGPDAASGQIYMKMLPDGEAAQLTRDSTSKMSPVFSPDGSRIAYSVVTGGNWDTWVVPVLNGQSRLWLTNASGLVWLDRHNLLFSEIKNKDIHMAIVAAQEDRGQARDVYVPAGDRGMAHRSYPSPDGNWALVVEMDGGQWLPCRLVSMSTKFASRQVGPANASCTFAAWSLDGRWMYLSSSADGRFHIWRQRFPDGQPEQITSGLTEEEGIAMAPDGRSFITSVGLKQSVVWVHDSTGERQISIEGYSYDPIFTPDGRRLCYRVLKGAAPENDPSELRIAELDSGHTEPLLPGLAVTGQPGKAYDVSPNGRQVVAAAPDREGKRRLWLTALDRQSPPQQIPDVEGDQPFFGPDGEVFFRAFEGGSLFAYRVRQDGTGLRKLIEQPVAGLNGISPNGEWLMAKTLERSTSAFPVRGGRPLRVLSASASLGASFNYFLWSNTSISISISNPQSLGSGVTYLVPTPSGQAFPKIPAGGFQSLAQLSRLPGARMIDAYSVAPGPSPDVYAFSRTTVLRNLYRIPLH